MPEAPNRRLVVVDDERDIVDAYASFLAPRAPAPARKSSRVAASQPAPTTKPQHDVGYEILKAYSGQEAIDLVARELQAGRKIAGGFFDVKMPGAIDGLEAIRAIWKLDPEMHVTVVTAYQDRDVNDIDQLFGARFQDQWDYLNKPFTQAEIVQKARQMTAAWNRRAHLAETRNQLVHSERLAAIGQVARSIGHEFGNVLQAIMARADLALSQLNEAQGLAESAPALQEALKAKLQVILSASETASHILRNLQTFARKGSGERRTLEPGPLVDSALNLLHHELTKRSVTVVKKVAPAGQVVFQANAVEIEQVLLNLVINAAHAMPGGGTLEIGSARAGQEARVWVRDTGTGIDPEVLPRIFEYAFTTKGDQGSGLGLAISRQIVENHGGRLSVETTFGQSQGNGTTFTLVLPLSGS